MGAEQWGGPALEVAGEGGLRNGWSSSWLDTQLSGGLCRTTFIWARALVAACWLGIGFFPPLLGRYIGDTLCSYKTLHKVHLFYNVCKNLTGWVYWRQSFYLLCWTVFCSSFISLVFSLRVSAGHGFLCVHTDRRTDRWQGCDLWSGLLGATE